MLRTPRDLYKSKEWQALIEQLRIERTDENGELRCWYCGEPIYQKYDCIGHHEIELTEENVNDYSVSLNPDNVRLIHFKCHNKIHERFEGFKQRVFLVYGAPCSGKSTWVHNVALADDLILDIDSIWEAVSVSDRYHKPNRLKPNVFGIRDCILDQIKTRTGAWRNAYVIGGYPLRSDRDRICELLSAEPIFIEETKENCLNRANTAEWKDYIEEWFADFVR